MADMTSTIKAKSDQLNAGDILAGPVTVRVIGVEVRGGDQPVSIHTEGDLQPYKPCLSMRRVLAKLWGGETDNWVGKHMVLFNDPTVIWAGKPEGGIRISQMEGLNKKEEVTVRASKRAVTKYLIDPLVIQQAQENPPPEPKTDKPLSLEQKAILMQLATFDDNGSTAWTQVACDVMDENKLDTIENLPASKFELVKKQLSANLV
jgi:hypothetical protein